MVDLFKVIVGLCLLAVVSSQSAPIVTTKLGSIRGSIMKTERNADIYAFRGIRYAQAPVGSLRFKPPVAVTKWETQLDATKDGFFCPQRNVSEELISEDCLILNVYSGDLKANRAVIVYIHAGAFTWGGSHSELEAGPEYFLDKNVVLVTLNYRLGALGFVTTRTADAPGNNGFLDQVMALQWVHDHISNFGGNPESVTIAGFSAGSMAVTLHMSSPLSKGLFHRGIAMSASTTNHHNIDNLYWTRLTARQASCPMYNPAILLGCLRKVPWQKFVSIRESWNAFGFENYEWSYEIDGHFLTDHPTNIFAQGKFNKVPLLTGIVKDEFTDGVHILKEKTNLFDDISLNFEKYAPELFKISPDADINYDELKTFYLGNKSINEQKLSNFGLIFSDAIVIHSFHRLLHLARQYVDVYFYRFDYVGRDGKYTDLGGDPNGVTHSADYQYIFTKNSTPAIHIGDPEWFMVERLTGLFTTFAQTSSPGSVGNVTWLPSNKENVRVFYNDKDVRMGDEPFLERMKFWDKLFPIARSGSSTMHVAGMLTGIAAILTSSVNTHFKRV